MPQPLIQLDPRNIPAYPIVDAAQYLAIPSGTLQSWLRGRTYQTNQGAKYFNPLRHLRSTPNRGCNSL